MTKPVALMVDLSSNNAAPNLAQHWAAGYRIIALKATEGTAYTWTAGAALTKAWHRLGGRVVHYHFARPGSGVAQADHYLAAVAGRWADGDLLCLDAETDGVNGTLARAFINRCHAKKPTAGGLIYGPPYFLRDHGIKPAHGWGLWLAQYASRVSLIPPGWDRWDVWQYTDHATVPGCPAPVDQSKVRRELLLAAEPKTPPMTDGHRAVVRDATKILNDRKHALNEADRRRVAALVASGEAALRRKS